MEADYTSSRLSDLAISNSESLFDFRTLCKMHYSIFQDVYEWAGKVRLINIEKEEPALGGISIEYSENTEIENDIISILNEMNLFEWQLVSLNTVAKHFSVFMSRLWRVYPFREGNTRTIITFCCQFIEAKGWFIDSDLFRENAQYMRTALVAASAVFHDLGDMRKTEYIEAII